MLVDLSETMLGWFLKILGINVPVPSAEDYDFHGKNSDLISDMCLALQGDMYIFGSQGRDYADIETFTKSGITPLFKDKVHSEYAQQYGDFVSYLGIVDLLFNCGHNSLEILMSGNISKESNLNS